MPLIHACDMFIWLTPKLYMYINNIRNQTPAVASVFCQKGTAS